MDEKHECEKETEGGGKKDQDDWSYPEYSFPLHDLDTAAVMPPIFEADLLRLSRGPRGYPDLRVALEEYKAGKEGRGADWGGLGEDYLKHIARGRMMIMRDYTLTLAASPGEVDMADLMVRRTLRGCLGEIELFLNFLIANIHQGLLSILAEDIAEQLDSAIQVLQEEGATFQGDVMLRSLTELKRRAEWLAKKEQPPPSSHPDAPPCKNDFLHQIQGLRPAEGAVWIITVGFISGTLIEKRVKLFEDHIEKRDIGRPSRILLLHTERSKRNCDEFERKLKGLIGRWRRGGWNVQIERKLIGESEEEVKRDLREYWERCGDQHAVLILDEFMKSLYEHIIDAAQDSFQEVDVYALVPLAEPAWPGEGGEKSVQTTNPLLCRVEMPKHAGERKITQNGGKEG